VDASGLWRARFRGGAAERFAPMATSLAVRTPLAATVSFRDRGLYVLDQVIGRDGLPVVRLLRFDALRGGGRLIGSFARPADADRIWLALDRDGTLLVQMSSERLARHAIFRIEVDPVRTPRVWWLPGAGTLAYPLMVDPHGYVLYRRARGALRPARTAALALRTSTWSQLANPFL
jgi:hypothetical protein